MNNVNPFSFCPLYKTLILWYHINIMIPSPSLIYVFILFMKVCLPSVFSREEMRSVIAE